VIADLDTLLTALYVELTDRIIPSLGLARSGPGQPPEVTDAELVCLAVAQVLLRYDDERHWLRAAAKHVGHLFPRLLGQSEYNQRVKAAAPLMEAALRWLAEHSPGSAVRRSPRAPLRHTLASAEARYRSRQPIAPTAATLAVSRAMLGSGPVNIMVAMPAPPGSGSRHASPPARRRVVAGRSPGRRRRACRAGSP
jgi:hypothetical protein